MAHISETDSISSTQSSIWLTDGGIREHLQPVHAVKAEIRKAAKKFRAAYARLSVMDPQTWEDRSCDLDLFDEVQEVDNQLMNICSAITTWSQEIAAVVDPCNEGDKSFCKAVRAFVERMRDMVEKSPFLLRSNREDAHQMRRREIRTIQAPPEGNKGMYDDSVAPLAPPSKTPRQASPAWTEMEGSFQFPPGSINVNQQEVGGHRPIAIGIRRHSQKRLSFSRETSQAEAQGPLSTPLIDLNGPPAPLAQAAAQ